MAVAVCIRCGQVKTHPIYRCPRCGLQPESDEDKAKSLMLSTAYELDGDSKAKSAEELRIIASAIEAGQPYPFVPTEVRDVIAYARQVTAIPASRLIIDGVKWLLPPFLILAIVYWLLFTTR